MNFSGTKRGNGDGPRLFCRTHFIARNRERIKTVHKAVIAAVGKAKAMDVCLTARFMEAADQLLDEGLLFERRAFHASFGLEDQKEGMAAFVEKRKANFRNR
jgi:enoyl-CoA hydratase/carnithine racemase